MDVVIFFAVVFTVYGLVNAYIFRRGWSLLPQSTPAHIAYAAVFIAIACAFIAGRILERVAPGMLSDILVWMGSIWLAAMTYLFLSAVLIDLLRLANAIVPYFPESVRLHPMRIARIAAAVVLIVTGITVAAGFINARHARVRPLALTLPRRGSDVTHLRIAMASDIHLGTIVGHRRFSRIVDSINRLHADIILLPGDVIDEDLEPVIRQDLGDKLRELSAPLGVYAVTGNHEYIGGVERACAYLSEHGVTMLRDTAVRVGNAIVLAGREDRSRNRFVGRQRKELNAILATVDRDLPVVLMDHQPFELHEARDNGVDLQISGHTHHGQLWPFNLITEAIYDVSWGYLAEGETHYYVSSGAGTWGPPVRTGNRPEIVQLDITFR